MNVDAAMADCAEVSPVMRERDEAEAAKYSIGSIKTALMNLQSSSAESVDSACPAAAIQGLTGLFETLVKEGLIHQ